MKDAQREKVGDFNKEIENIKNKKTEFKIQ